MRAGRSTTVAAVAGALALTALAAPAAQAADTGITVPGVVVNGGRPIVVGTTKEATPVSATASIPTATPRPGKPRPTR
ncbi:hypothetical protein [Streptomyces sp. NPDC088766]|uniref:hypothetical protein n=1 Tax=Streptomyces sp. NPDC088766 TaxID=3365893 RepID=UPI00380E47A0